MQETSKYFLLVLFSLFLICCNESPKKEKALIESTSDTVITKAQTADTISDTTSIPKPISFESKFKLFTNKSGNKNGYAINMHVYDSIAGQVVFYRNDSVVWMAFPMADRMFLRPIKGGNFIQPNFRQNSRIEVICPYNDFSNNIFYEGLFINGERAGIHKVYHTNGKIKFLVDYSTQQYKEFSRSGKLIAAKAISEYRFPGSEEQVK